MGHQISGISVDVQSDSTKPSVHAADAARLQDRVVVPKAQHAIGDVACLLEGQTWKNIFSSTT